MHIDFDDFARCTGADRGLLVVAPHPDDECAGAGGLIALCAEAGLDITVVVVTDGAASHPGSRDWPSARLAALRRMEAEAAVATLGTHIEIVFLGLPDAGTLTLEPGERQAAIAALRREIAARSPGLVVTTWRREPHCDHRFAYELAKEAVADTPSRLAEYLVWTPINGGDGDAPAPGEMRRLDLDISSVRKRKQDALGAHRSQRGLVIDDDPEGFVLTDAQFAAMTGPVEVYLC
jgi:LmbE family N-acetylglucosaminyl deacetylase